MSDEPNLAVLAGYVRNRIKAGQPAEFVAHAATIVVVALPGARLMVASNKGESVILSGTEHINSITFVKGRFSIQRARFLTRLFDAMREKAELAVTSR